jgi:uncharacterized membrane protein YraQ (UPF0718 family)
LAGLDVIGRSLEQAFFMFWVTLWPLVLGFSLSGAIQSFAAPQGVEHTLGHHGFGGLARASAYGMASSSCSYAAAATAKSLFVKGADFVAICVFMVASTNLVLELGLVLLVLIGWQFALSEFVGGAIMIVLLGAFGGLWFRGRLVTSARERLSQGDRGHNISPDPVADVAPLSERLGTGGGWADAASYAVADVKMLRRELLLGFVVAGFLAVAVPARAWSDLFVHGHGIWTTLENAVVGPPIAIVSFVCSIGNVPLAAALWKDGISFGGVVAFVFADLITLPLLLVYRRYYGTRLTARILIAFWSVMSLAGLATQELFAAVGWIPTHRPRVVAPEHFLGGVTVGLNAVFVLVGLAAVWADRHRATKGGSATTAVDSICGMVVGKNSAPAIVDHGGHRHYFCSDSCRDRFDATVGPSSVGQTGRS